MPKDKKTPTAGDDAKVIPAEKTVPAPAPAVKPNGKSILIVEDEKPLAHALELKMSHEGFQTTVAPNGGDGLREALTDKYDLILLDLIMPEVDGFAILQAMQEKHVKTPVIILSNLGQQEDQERAKKLGAKEYFVKANTPITDILAAVKKTL